MNEKDIVIIESDIQNSLSKLMNDQNKKRIYRFILSSLGSIPWVGGFLGATADLLSDKEQSKVNELHKLWIVEHQEKIEKLGETIYGIINKLEQFDSLVNDRMESQDYQDIVKKGFRAWDKCDTDEKRDLIRNLLTNSCASKITTDDVIRLFIDWINTYHEAHFIIIKEIYQNPGITRGGIWDKFRGARPKDNSAEANLYKMFIRDLSMGEVIRQSREANTQGQYYKNTYRRSSSNTLTSAFDDEKPYELTELGKQFVHYTMTDVVPKIAK